MNDIVLVSYDNTTGDIPVLIVGKKDIGNGVHVVNAFAGDEATTLYDLLMEGKEKYETAKETDS